SGRGRYHELRRCRQDHPLSRPEDGAYHYPRLRWSRYHSRHCPSTREGIGSRLQARGPVVQTCRRRMLRHQKWAGVLLMGARKEGRREPRRATLPTEVNRNASVPRLNGQEFFPNLFKQPTPGLGIPPKQTVPSPSAFICGSVLPTSPPRCKDLFAVRRST